MKEARGAVIADVTDGSPAEKAGLKPEDVVLERGRPARAGQLRPVALRGRQGARHARVRLHVLRGGAEKRHRR